MRFQVDCHQLPGRQTTDALKACVGSTVGHSSSHELSNRAVVRPHGVEKGQKLLDLRAEREDPWSLRVVQWLDAEPIHAEHESPGADIEDRESPHSIESSEALEAPLAVGMEHHLGISARLKSVAASDELLAKLEVVVDLAVERQKHRPIRDRHRLGAGSGQVEDREAAVAKVDEGCLRFAPRRRLDRAVAHVGVPAPQVEQQVPFTVGTAVIDDVRHLRQIAPA